MTAAPALRPRELDDLVAAVDYRQTDERLENWGRWAGGGLGGAANTCGSAEKRWVPPRADEEKVRRSGAPIDVQDAELIERAICALPSPSLRTVLVWRYALQWRDSAICRRLRLHRDSWTALHARVVLQVGGLAAAQSAPLIRRGVRHWAGCTR